MHHYLCQITSTWGLPLQTDVYTQLLSVLLCLYYYDSLWTFVKRNSCFRYYCALLLWNVEKRKTAFYTLITFVQSYYVWTVFYHASITWVPLNTFYFVNLAEIPDSDGKRYVNIDISLLLYSSMHPIFLNNDWKYGISQIDINILSHYLKRSRTKWTQHLYFLSFDWKAIMTWQ